MLLMAQLGESLPMPAAKASTAPSTVEYKVSWTVTQAPSINGVR